ncbi:hypothetical protein [Shewanella surugensis]|nr:hypothetical protein [Shewanella surugensis]
MKNTAQSTSQRGIDKKHKKPLKNKVNTISELTQDIGVNIDPTQ